MFPRLFEPGRVGSLELPNRIVFAATSSELADKDGFVGDDLVEYYAERARGGTGLLVLEATYVEQEGKRLHHNAMLHDDCFIPGLRKVVEATHAEGVKIAAAANPSRMCPAPCRWRRRRFRRSSPASVTPSCRRN